MGFRAGARGSDKWPERPAFCGLSATAERRDKNVPTGETGGAEGTSNPWYAYSAIFAAAWNTTLAPTRCDREPDALKNLGRSVRLPRALMKSGRPLPDATGGAFCVTLALEKTLKSPLSIASWRKISDGIAARAQAGRGGLLAPKTERHRSERNIRRRGPALPPQAFPFRRPRPHPLGPAIRDDGFPRSHGAALRGGLGGRPWEPAAKIWLLRPIAAGMTKKSARISGANRSCPRGSTYGECDRWRIFASLCVTLRTEKTLKLPLSERFLGQNRWSNCQNGEKAGRRKGLGRVYRCYKSVASWRIGVRSPAAQEFAPSAGKFAEFRIFVLPRRKMSPA